MYTCRSRKQHFGDMEWMYAFRTSPSWMTCNLAQLTAARSAAALVVVITLMDFSKTGIAQDGVDYPGYPSGPPPPVTLTPPPPSLTPPPPSLTPPPPSLTPPPPSLTPPAAFLGSESTSPPPLVLPPPSAPTPPAAFLDPESTSPPPLVLPPPTAPTQTNLFPPPPPVQLSPAMPSAPPPPFAPPARAEQWNDSYPATDFRDASVPHRYILWPENLPYVKFVYFCQEVLFQPKRNLTDFSYEGSAIGSQFRLQVRPYLDLGLVDKNNTPYFRRWRFNWLIDIHRIVCPVVCEYTDIQRLYKYRLHKSVLGIGFGYGLAAVLILELGVTVCIILLWLVNFDEVRRKGSATEDQSLAALLWDWCKNLEFWLDFFPDWAHLVLLVIAGFSMMEASGHSNFYEWRSMLFYNIGVTYTWLTLLAMVSSTLFQCAQFLSSRQRPDPSQVVPFQVADSPQIPMRRFSKKASTKTSGALLVEDSTASSMKAEPKIFEKVMKEFDSDDWKYQRIFGQSAVLILMSMYLLMVDDYQGNSMDSLASLIVGAVVVACIWSFAVGTVVAIRSLRSIFRGIFGLLCTRSSKSSRSLRSSKSSRSLRSSKSSRSSKPVSQPEDGRESEEESEEWPGEDHQRSQEVVVIVPESPKESDRTIADI